MDLNSGNLSVYKIGTSTSASFHTGLSKVHAKWIQTLQPHSILGSNTVSSRRAPTLRLQEGHRHFDFTRSIMTKKSKAETDLSWYYCIRR